MNQVKFLLQDHELAAGHFSFPRFNEVALVFYA